jgi:signal transduction histidine kinase/CheY-like chemotaxis protein
MRYLAYSEQWKQQYCPQEDNLLGRCHYDIFPDLPSKWVGYCDRAIKGEIVGAKEEVFELPPDKRFYIKWTAQPWYTPENTIGGIVIVSQNINELVKARESAIENAQIKARFLANMSHEIRTPMNGILGMAELLLNQTTHAQQKELLTVLYQSGQHLLVIINDILDFSKLEAKETHLEHQPFNLPECVQSVVRLLTPQAEAKHISLTVDIPTNIPTYVLGDVNRLRQILTNLAGNSVKFTDEGGVHIAVELKSWQETEALIRFSVIDNGLGIKPQHQSKLFRSFSQIDDSSTRNYGGTGLGLAISKQLVELMGGTIGLESKYGQGSTFWIEVPWEIADHDFYGDNLPALDLSQMNALIVREYENKESRHKLWHGLNYWQVNVTQVETLALVMDQLHAGDDHRYDLIIVPYHSEVPNFCRNVETLRQQMPHATIAIMLAAQELELLKPWLAQHNLQELVCPFTGNHILEELMTHFNLDSPGDNSTMDLSQERANFKILIAEDTRINQEVIINQLQTIGYSAITCVSNGELALSAMEKEHFDLILMDCLMPVLDGYQTTEIIRDREADQEHIPIIALTASAIVGEQQKCLAVGMDEYISKPISMKALEKVLDRYVLKKVQLQVQGDHSPALAHGPLINFERLEKFWGSDRALWKQMLHIYQEDAPIYAQELQAAIEEEDYELIYNHAHRLKGASSSAAVEIIPHLCHDIEKLAQQKTTENMDKIMTKIFEQLAQVYSLAKEFQSS